ncbi:MAG TPA: glycosyltransferase 87 family protein, partial [Vicinamibacteria bacterium]|nr:glycosyltransferase 87 family protein [Vicinamibacteria bacterium]
LPMLSALQKGNLQLAVVAFSMVAMVLFERGRPAAGGALLAFAAASKLYPGLLVLYLLVRRQWRALGWTAFWGAVLTAAALADLGWRPFRDFFAHLPLLLSGEAFPAFRNPAAMANNFSVPGLVFKLKVLGIGQMGFGAAKVVGWIYTVVAVWATVAVARRTLSPRDLPVAWLAIIAIATLRSPFLPQAYAAFPLVWLLALLAALQAPSPKQVALTAAAWLALNVFIPPDLAAPATLALASLVPQGVTYALAALAVRHVLARRHAAAPALAPAPAVAV